MTDAVVSDLADKVLAVKPAGRRRLIALAGAPASGKSTLAEALVAELNRRGEHAIVVPMDGFHLDNRILTERGLLSRKGAPETFDSAGFVATMRRLGTEAEVILPTFDRSRDLSVAGAIAVTADHSIAVVEGNYLCCDLDPWRDLLQVWDMSIALDVPEDELERRLIQRWLDHGLEPTAAEARARSNDLANARLVTRLRQSPDILLPLG